MPQARHISSYENSALLVAQGELTYTQIAKRCEIDADTLLCWRKEPEFSQFVAAHREDLLEEARAFGLGQRWKRVRERQRRHDALMRVIEERAMSPIMQSAPGGSTGLLVQQVKILGRGRNAARIDQFRVDVDLLRELRALEREVAIELGQWLQKSSSDHTAMVCTTDDLPEWIKARPRQSIPTCETRPADRREVGRSTFAATEALCP